MANDWSATLCHAPLRRRSVNTTHVLARVKHALPLFVEATMRPPTIIERAFELARSGACRSVDDIKKKLRAEGFENPEGHLQRSLATQLRTLLKARDTT